MVYRAKDTVLARDVALKVIDRVKDDAASADTLRQFVCEARTAAQLDHPNIVRIFDITRSQGRVAIAMELCTGGSLADRVATEGALPWRTACNILADAAQGLAHAHQQNIVHRDIKPANLMFNAQGQCKVADFGLARRMDQREAKHLQGKVVGTPYYTAPEHLRHLELTPVSDLYSLGITLWVAITGAPTFQASTSRRVYHQHLQSPVPDLAELAPDTPPQLVQLLHDLLAKEPSQRPQDAMNVSRTLRRIAAAPATATSQPVKKIRRSYAGIIGAVVSVSLLGAVALAIWQTFVSNSSPSTPPQVSGVAQVSSAPLIHNGQPTDAVIQRGVWTVHENMIEGSGVNSDLTLRKPVVGDARVRIRLALSQIKGTIASLKIDGQSKFCFDGRGRVLYVQGPVFGFTRVHKLGESQDSFEPNVPFDLELTRRNGELSIAINQREIYRGPDDRPDLGTLSLHPHRNVMRVYEWIVTDEAAR